MSTDVTETEWAYVAGLLDGEGHIGVPIHGGDHVFNKNVGISNTNPKILPILKRVGFHLFQISRRAPNKDVHRALITTYSEIETFLKRVRPYLILKCEQADLMIELCSIRAQINVQTLRNEERHYGTRELEIATKIRFLNRRGVHP